LFEVGTNLMNATAKPRATSDVNWSAHCQAVMSIARVGIIRPAKPPIVLPAT